MCFHHQEVDFFNTSYKKVSNVWAIIENRYFFDRFWPLVKNLFLKAMLYLIRSKLDLVPTAVNLTVIII